MTSSATTADDSVRVTSLRWRWYRAFALLTAVIVLAGMAGLLSTQLLAQSFQGSATRVEREASASATLRADIVTHAILFTSPPTAAQQSQVNAIQLAIRAGYGQAVANESSAAARTMLRRSLTDWEAIVAAAGPPDHPATVTQRGAAVSVKDPEVLDLLDQAGSISRAAVRVEVAAQDHRVNASLALVALLELLAIALAVRLARHLSKEVLRPVSLLRESANHLASGNFEHRVVIDRADELGELAMSFNAMADAIAGNQRTLSVEAATDSLSGLANRASFRARLEDTLGRVGHCPDDEAVLFVDLDDFKDVNDSLGHAAGDEVLRVVATRLRRTVRPEDLVARLGGDEFALLLDGRGQPAGAFTVAERVVAALAEPVDIGPNQVHVGASVGLAMRQDDSTLDSLMREADVAMYAAKAKGKNRVERYDAALDKVAVARNQLKVDLSTAVERDELVVDYQPVVDLDTGMMVGLEALVRWQHPTRGLLPPSEFIALAEETGAIVGIGAWVLATSARRLERWQRIYQVPDLWMSVNVSVCQLEVPAYAANVRNLLHSTGLDPATLILEVTESVLADPSGGAATALTALRAPGVRVALDDFGTGYSSIGYLLQLPVDILKIDRTFVSGTSAAGPNTVLLEAVVAMAHRLGLFVIPEGIEEPDQLHQLRAMGCHIGQGFLLSRPASADAIEALLAEPTTLCDIALWEAVCSTQLAST